MTLVVGRIRNGSIAIVADTQLTGPGGEPLPVQQGVVKSVLLPGGLCVSFAGSPELAGRDIWDFARNYHDRWDFSSAVRHFEASSKRNGVDYLLAFAPHPKLIKIADGRRIESVSSTQWIGSKDAYEAFRATEARARKGYYRGRAYSGVLAANIGENSALDGLYESLRQIIAERCCSTVGGLTSVVVRSGDSFIFPCFSAMLYDWPFVDDARDLKLTDPIDFLTSGENSEFSVSQFSTAYANLSIVGFYFPHAEIAYVFVPKRTLIADSCEVLRSTTPIQLVQRLDGVLQLGKAWRLFVAVSRNATGIAARRGQDSYQGQGIGIAFEMLANTFPPSGLEERVTPMELWLPGPKG